MRLSERLRAAIVDAARHSFGDTPVYLFGSRVNDKLKGGDIDLAISVDLTPDLFRRQKAAFLTVLLRQGLELPIDLVQLSSVGSKLQTEIITNGIRLH